jgi:hypothetical protein
MTSTAPRMGRVSGRLRLAVAGAAVVTSLTAATAAAAPPTPMREQADTGPRSLTPGFLLDRGRYTTLEVPGATVETGAGGINNRGQIVGFTASDLATETARGFLLAKGARGPFTPISFPGAPSTVALGLNDRGQITGAYNNPNAAPSPPPATATPMAPMG